MDTKDWPSQQLFTLQLKADDHAVGASGGCLYETAVALGFSSREATQLRLAVEEAVSNVQQHAYDPSCPGMVEVSGHQIGGGLRVSVRDWGVPLYELHPDSAHGLHRMQELTCKVELHNLGASGKEIVLEKHVGLPRSLDSSEEPPLSNEEVSIREMLEGEEQQVCLCFYSGYGYSYVHPDIYYPEKLREHTSKGLIRPMVAVTESGRIVGFTAIVRERETDGWGELAMAIVHPDYRGLHLFERMAEALVRVARESMDSLYGHAVSVHPISQHVLHNLGMTDTGVLLGFAPPTTVSQKSGSRLRQTLILGSAVFGKDRPTRTFYAPRHEKMIRNLAEKLGYSVEFATQGSPSTSHSRMSSSLAAGLNVGTVNFKQLGEDAVGLAASALRQMCLKHVDVALLYLPLGDPGLIDALPALEELGFFFGGLHPGWNGGDALVLQYHNNFELETSSIVLESPDSEALLSYVLDCYQNTTNATV